MEKAVIGRNEFFEIVENELGTEDRERIEWAYSLAKNYHRPQKRENGDNYFAHCQAVALISFKFPPTCPSEIILCLLHDVYEDQFVPRGMIRRLFGERLDEGLRTLSDCKPFYGTRAMIEKVDKSKEEYYKILMEAPLIVRRVKLADRLHNLQTLHQCPPDKIKRKIFETLKRIIPLAEITNDKFLNAIKQECKKYSVMFE